MAVLTATVERTRPAAPPAAPAAPARPAPPDPEVLAREAHAMALALQRVLFTVQRLLGPAADEEFTLGSVGLDRREEALEPFAPWLRAALAQRGWSVHELARRVGTDAATVRFWQDGLLAPSARYIPGLAAALNVEPEEIARRLER